MSNPLPSELACVFVNLEPDDKEWSAHIDLLNKYTTPDRYLRHIIQYARSGPHHPADMHVNLIEQLFEQKYQCRATEMLDRLEGKSYGIKQYIEVSQHPARSVYVPERVPATNKVISLSDVQAERTNLKQLSEGDNHARK